MFSLGNLCTTPAALAALLDAGRSPSRFLDRHASGDWGDLSPEDKAANHAAVRGGGRIVSRYCVGDRPFYIITEDDRSRTTILLSSVY